MNGPDVERALAEYIETEIAYDRGGLPIRPDEPLLEGMIDSTSMLRLVLFMEERFGIRVADDELVPEVFETVGSLAKFVEAKRS